MRQNFHRYCGFQKYLSCLFIFFFFHILKTQYSHSELYKLLSNQKGYAVLRKDITPTFSRIMIIENLKKSLRE